MQEKTGIVTSKGNPVTLLGPELKVGEAAPDFTAIDIEMQPKTLADFKGRILVLSAVPSLDTPICDMETRRFNQEAGRLDDAAHVVTVSMDLPFAQKRWCGATNSANVVTLSDHREASFGLAYGVLIKELRLLARFIFVVDPAGTITHIHHTPEISSEPDYNEVMQAVRNLL